mmetsp:Transcript_2944/g.4225  ORF Transcript_2944/g.4225 Transcript_2944/m.4225 type:complete len:140 (-) Transcript_2944:190-609(-)
MFTLNESIPHLPIHILCEYFHLIQIPSRNNVNDLDCDVSPRQRWKMLQIVETTLLSSVPAEYARRQHNRLVEVAYIVEKSLLAFANVSSDYLNIRTLNRRVNSVVCAIARSLIDSHHQTHGGGRGFLLTGRRNQGAGAA